jgi:hypothetical protein
MNLAFMCLWKEAFEREEKYKRNCIFGLVPEGAGLRKGNHSLLISQSRR